MTKLVDKRDLPIFIHSSIDDMTGLTPNAMRVYMHLARRADKDGVAWPSYQSVGDHCFGCISDNAATRKSFARKAIADLLGAGLILKTPRVNDNGEYSSNAYQLVNPPMPIGTPMPIKHTPMPIGTPVLNRQERYSNEDTPIEDTPQKREINPLPSLSQLGQRQQSQRTVKTQADANTLAAKELGLAPGAFRLSVDAVLDATGKRALADAEPEERTLNAAKECVLTLGRMGFATIEDVQSVLQSWKDNDWRGTSVPSFAQLTEHASAMKAGTHVTARSAESGKKDFGSMREYEEWALRHDPTFQRIREGILVKGTRVKREQYQPKVAH